MNPYIGDNEFPELFPEDFKENILPVDAKPEELTVYRLALNGVINTEAFLSTYEYCIINKKMTLRDINKEYGLSNPSTYSTSCYEKYKDVKNACKCLKKHYPPIITITGTTTLSSGVLQRTKERTGEGKSHVDWWIYKNQDVSGNFEECVEEDVDERSENT